MPGKVILGAQWGDEGKGKFIDIFAGKADLVVRSQGGNNAGHTVVAGGEKYKLQLIPSGILYPECVNVIGPGVVVNPKAVLGEIDGLHEKGVSTDKLFIDARCHCIMPWHLELDALSEAEKAKEGTAIGTTKKGIGPTYMDKSERSGIRMHDFVDAERFEEVIRETCARKNRVITGVYGGEPIDADAVIAEYKVYADRLRPMVRDTTVMTYDAIKSGKEVLFEGAQGTLLDLDMGTYPYVTSSHPVAGGCCIGSGVGPTAINEIMGIFKSYTTRVGEGPFPTPLRGLPKLKVCVAYKLKNGETVTEFPANFMDLVDCEPVYEEFDGFDEDITNCRSFEELPATVQSYIKELERIIECPITMLGVGPARDQVMTIK